MLRRGHARPSVGDRDRRERDRVPDREGLHARPGCAAAEARRRAVRAHAARAGDRGRTGADGRPVPLPHRRLGSAGGAVRRARGRPGRGRRGRDRGRGCDARSGPTRSPERSCARSSGRRPGPPTRWRRLDALLAGVQAVVDGEVVAAQARAPRGDLRRRLLGAGGAVRRPRRGRVPRPARGRHAHGASAWRNDCDTPTAARANRGRDAPRESPLRSRPRARRPAGRRPLRRRAPARGRFGLGDEPEAARLPRGASARCTPPGRASAG